MQPILRLLVMAGLVTGCATATEPPLVEGEFDTLRLERTSGLGFCPPDGALITAQLDRRADGSFELQGTVAEHLTAPCFYEDCIAAHPIEPLALDPAQSARLVELVHEIPQKRCERDPSLACDPCLVESLTIDGTSVSGSCCGELNAGFEPAFGDLMSFLDILAAGAGVVRGDAGVPMPDAG